MGGEFEEGMILYNNLKSMYDGDLAEIYAHVTNVYSNEENPVFINGRRQTKATYCACHYFLSYDIEDEYMIEHGYSRQEYADAKTGEK